jgi:hypothetical protein
MIARSSRILPSLCLLYFLLALGLWKMMFRSLQDSLHCKMLNEGLGIYIVNNGIYLIGLPQSREDAPVHRAR